MATEYAPLLERIATALEQLALELAESNGRVAVHAPAPQPAPAPRFSPIGWTCPTHGSVKVVPAGVSARTGQPYDAFTVCGERGCNEKPGRAPQPVPQRAIPPSQGGQLP